MKDYIRERVIEEANYIIDTKNTVRQIADIFNVSKSTVHKDLTERLRVINNILYIKVRNILIYNKLDSTIRGGEATKRIYKNAA